MGAPDNRVGKMHNAKGTFKKKSKNALFYLIVLIFIIYVPNFPWPSWSCMYCTEIEQSWLHFVLGGWYQSRGWRCISLSLIWNIFKPGFTFVTAKKGKKKDNISHLNISFESLSATNREVYPEWSTKFILLAV